MAASQTAKLLIQRGADGRLRCASDPEMEGDREGDRGDRAGDRGDREGDRGDGEGDRISVLVESLVVVGRRLGVLNIEKYVAALDLADQVVRARARCRARVRCRARDRRDMKRTWPLSTKPTRWRRSRRSTTASAPTSAKARSNPDPNPNPNPHLPQHSLTAYKLTMALTNQVDQSTFFRHKGWDVRGGT